MKIKIPKEKIKTFCEKNNIIKLSLFGSVLTANFTPESDIDVLVEFKYENEPGFIGLSRMERELSSIVGRKVDLRTPDELSRYFRDEVLSEAKVQYGA